MSGETVEVDCTVCGDCHPTDVSCSANARELTVARCTKCGHQPHEALGFCPNLASDNDCFCEGEWTRADHEARTDRLKPLADHLRVGHDVVPELRRYQDTWLHIALLAEEWFNEARSGIDAAHLERQREWSRATFGPGPRLGGVLDHIRRELKEVEERPFDVTEWADVLILAFDGAWRSGHEPQAVIDAIKAKQATNEARTWPDWREFSEDEAIEHDRTVD